MQEVPIDSIQLAQTIEEQIQLSKQANLTKGDLNGDNLMPKEPQIPQAVELQEPNGLIDNAETIQADDQSVTFVTSTKSFKHFDDVQNLLIELEKPDSVLKGDILRSPVIGSPV